MGNCYINPQKNINKFSSSRIKKLTGFNFDNVAFEYICNVIVEFINDCFYDSIDFSKVNWYIDTKRYFTEDSFEFFLDELDGVMTFTDKDARKFIDKFPQIVKNLIDNKILIFEK